jgi:3-isopropylmalate/(R)-2-methylmalate dehydratase small subunit
MDKFVKLTATACPINQPNLNTDQILPARYLKWTRAMGIGKVLFQDLRFEADGNEKPDFPINKPAWRNAKIVVGARNFGCGSSREAAPRVIKAAGVSAVIAASFARIFFRNCINIGLPVITCDTQGIDEGDELEVDLAAGSVRDLTRRAVRTTAPLPRVMMNVIADGGLAAHIRRHGGYKLD